MPDEQAVASTSNIHSDALLKGFNSLREANELVDVTLNVNGRHYKAHKVVLSACSDYFRAMFTEKMVESGQNFVTLHEMSDVGFQTLFQYIYTSKLQLSTGNVQEVLSAASYLQVLPVVNRCSEYLKTELDVGNCVDVVSLAECFSLKELQRATYKFICTNFTAVATTPNLYRFTVGQMESVLKSNFPVDCLEVEILKYVLMWCLHKENSDKSCQHNTSRILRCINYNHMSQKSMEVTIDKVFGKLGVNKNNHFLYKALMKEFHNVQLPPLHPSLGSFNMRGMEVALVKIGGFHVEGLTNEITYCFADEQNWRHLTCIPHENQSGFGTAVLNNDLYIIGGCFYQALEEIIHPFGFKYQPRTREWSTIKPMLTSRCRFSLSVSEEMIFVIGGIIEVDSSMEGEATATCECYDSRHNSWRMVRSLPEVRSQHASATCEVDGREKIFVSGGVCKESVVASLLAYDVESDMWSVCARMPLPRADHFMFSYCGRLYVCGGWRDDVEMGSVRMHVDTIDAYNPSTDVWETVTRIPTPKFHAAIVVDVNKVYVIGGFRTDQIYHKNTSGVECYDIERDVWTFDDKPSQHYWEHSCVKLYVPRMRR